MERATRVIVITSVVVAGATDAWLAIWQPALPAASATAFAVTFLLARWSLPLALALVFGTMYVAPAIFYAVMRGGPYAADFQLTLVWLAAFAGPVLAHSDLARWHFPRRWVIPLVGWAVVIALSWPLVAAREIDFSLIAARTYDTSNGMFQGPPRAAAAWVAIIALAQMLGILWIDFLWARFRGPNLERAERVVIVPIVIGAAVAAVAGLYQRFVDLAWMNPGIWPSMMRASGFMLDANTFGMACAIWAPAAVVVAWRLNWPAWVAALLFVLLAAGEFTSGSRTALLALSAGTLGVAVAIAQRRGWWQSKMAPIVTLVGAAALVLAMAIAPRGGESSNPIQRVFDRLPRLEAMDISRFTSEMWTRFGYGAAAARIIAEHPVTGVGIGAFHIVAPDYIRRLKLKDVPSDNAQNWWRHQVAELGFLGSAPPLWMSLLIVGFVWRGGPYVEPFGATTVLRMVLTGVGLASLLGVPTQHPATWISFATLLFWLAALYGAVADGTRSVARGWWTAIAVAAMTTAGQAATARGDLRVPVRALIDGVPYRYGFSLEGVSQFGEFRWAAKHAVEVMPIQDAWVQLTIWPVDPDVGSNPVRARVWINQRRVIEHAITTTDRATYFIKAPQRDPKFMLLEVAASRAPQSDRALGVAHQWLSRVPADAPAERIIW